MNPIGLIILAIGIIMIVIGVKGSQHHVLQAFKGVPPTLHGTPVAPTQQLP